MPQSVTITGKLRDSRGTLLPDGRITVQLRSPLIDAKVAAPDEIWTTQPAAYTVTNGDINFTLLSSADVGIPYSFRVEGASTTVEYYLQGGAVYVGPVHQWTIASGGDDQWYTGSLPHDAETQDRLSRVEVKRYSPIFRDFDAIVPDVPELEFKELLALGAEFVSNPLAGLAYLADKLTTEPKYRDVLRVGRWMGAYSASVFYQYGDIVSNGLSFIYKSQTSSSGNAPPASGSNTYWDEFPAVVIPPASQDLTNYLRKDIDQTMAGVLSLPTPGSSPPSGQALPLGYADGRYARLGTSGQGVTQTIYGNLSISPTGTISVPDRGAGDNTTNAANTKFVTSAINTLNAPRLVVSAICDATPPGLALGSPVTTAGVTNIIFEQELLDGEGRYNNGTGDYVAPVSGVYEFECKLLIRFQNTTSSAGQDRVILRLYLYNFSLSTELGNFALLNVPASAVLNTYMLQGRVEARDITANHILVPRLAISMNTTGNAFISNPAIDTSQGNVQNMLRVYRLTY